MHNDIYPCNPPDTIGTPIVRGGRKGRDFHCIGSHGYPDTYFVPDPPPPWEYEGHEPWMNLIHDRLIERFALALDRLSCVERGGTLDEQI